jgi:hypothetical protein
MRTAFLATVTAQISLVIADQLLEVCLLAGRCPRCDDVVGRAADGTVEG